MYTLQYNTYIYGKEIQAIYRYKLQAIKYFLLCTKNTRVLNRQAKLSSLINYPTRAKFWSITVITSTLRVFLNEKQLMGFAIKLYISLYNINKYKRFL